MSGRFDHCIESGKADTTVSQPRPSEILLRMLLRMSDVSPVGRVYRPSWIDRLIRWIEQLPGPTWAFYLFVLLASILIVNAVRWFDGSLELGALDGFQTASTFYGVYALGLLHVLKRISGRSLESFRPALAGDDRTFTQLHFQLTTIPARGALIATGVGLLAAAAAVLFDPEVRSGFATSPITTIATVAVIYWAVVLVPILFYSTVRQLGLVAHIHRDATNIDLFQPGPLYSFSALSACAGLGLAFFNYYSVATDPTTFTNPVWLAVLIISVVLAVMFFLFPLYGMHRRIIEEKDRLEAAANKRLQATIGDLHERVDRRELSDADELNKTLTSLSLERQMLEKLPTWPWKPDTFRGFFTALLLPIILWLITRLLERIVF